MTSELPAEPKMTQDFSQDCQPKTTLVVLLQKHFMIP